MGKYDVNNSYIPNSKQQASHKIAKEIHLRLYKYGQLLTNKSIDDKNFSKNFI